MYNILFLNSYNRDKFTDKCIKKVSISQQHDIQKSKMFTMYSISVNLIQKITVQYSKDVFVKKNHEFIQTPQQQRIVYQQRYKKFVIFFFIDNNG